MTTASRDAAKLRFHDDVARCIREERIAAGMTIADLARAVGTSANTIGLIERGTTTCSLFTASRIADALDITIDALAPVQIDEREAFNDG